MSEFCKNVLAEHGDKIVLPVDNLVVKEFSNDVRLNRITDILSESLREKHISGGSESEINSWNNSLHFMKDVLDSPCVPKDCRVAVEYNIPQTSKRVDFMILGSDAAHTDHVVIVELKQWDKITEVNGTDALVETFVGGSNHRVVHPSYQAWSYAQLIYDYNSSVQDKNVKLNPCACLHNYIRHENDPLDSAIYSDYLIEAPAYTKGQLDQLRSFIKKSVKLLVII